MALSRSNIKSIFIEPTQPATSNNTPQQEDDLRSAFVSLFVVPEQNAPSAQTTAAKKKTLADQIKAIFIQEDPATAVQQTPATVSSTPPLVIPQTSPVNVTSPSIQPSSTQTYIDLLGGSSAAPSVVPAQPSKSAVQPSQTIMDELEKYLSTMYIKTNKQYDFFSFVAAVYAGKAQNMNESQSYNAALSFYRKNLKDDFDDILVISAQRYLNCLEEKKHQLEGLYQDKLEIATKSGSPALLDQLNQQKLVIDASYDAVYQKYNAMHKRLEKDFPTI